MSLDSQQQDRSIISSSLSLLGDSAETPAPGSGRMLDDFAGLTLDWFWEMDAKLNYSYVSDRFTEITGIPKNLVLGMTIEELGIVDDRRESWQRHLETLTDRHSFRNFQFSHVHPDGRDVLLSVGGDPTFDRAGNFSGYRGTGREISDLLEATKARPENRAFYQLAGQIPNLGFWEWDEIADTCVFCSKEMAKIHGVSVEEYLRLSTSNEADRRWMHPDDRARYDVAANLFHTEHKGFEIEYRLLRADGEIADVSEAVVPIIDEHGNLIRSFGFVRDISEPKKALAQIEKVTNLFRHTEELAHIGHWEWDEIEDRCVYCSEELARLCGLSVQEYLDIAIDYDGDLTIVHPSDRKEVAATDALYMTSPVRTECEYRLLCVDGRVRYVREIMTPVFDENGEHVRSLGSMQDISESRKAADRLRLAHDNLEQRVQERTAELRKANDRLIESETRLRDAAKIAKLGYFKWNLVERKGAFCDEGLAKILGVSVDNFIGETADDFLTRVHPDDVEMISAAYDKCREKGASVDIEYRLIGPNGEVRYVHELATPQPDPDGVMTQAFGTVQDITDRKSITEELLLVEERLRELGANAREVLYVLTADWRDVIYISDAFEAIWGYSGQRLFDDPRLWLESLHPADRDMITAEIQDKVHGNDTSPDFSDCRIVGSDGEVHWLSTSVYPIHDSDGVVVRYAGIVEDITERRAAIEALNQAQKMDAVGQLTGGVAHDFNNLLAVILGNSELLHGNVAEDDEPLLSDIIAAGQRGAELTSRLLAFSRLQPLQPVTTNVVKLVEGMGELLRRTLGPTITVEIGSSCADARALIDTGLLENAILNLALNARDAMPDGGHLLLRVADSTPQELKSSMSVDQNLTIVVQDDGIGMEPEILSHVLEPFFTTKPAGEGSGLGLPMVYGFVKQSNGDLLVDSSPGEGTIVTICLPSTVPDAKARMTQDA